MSTSIGEPRVSLQEATRVRTDLFSRILLYRKQILRIVLGAMLLTAAIILVQPRTWTARGSFVAQGGQGESLGQLAGLASQFGVNINSSSGYPPRFFAALMTSDQVLRTMVDRTYSITEGGVKRTVRLEEALDIKGRNPRVRRQKAINKLRRDVIGAIFDQRTGVTSFSVSTDSPELSVAIAQVLIGEINKFNTERHRSRASIERRFVEDRRIVVAGELRAAEQRLESFLTQNRLISGSPQRTLELERLKRRAAELEQVVEALSRSYERARIEEVRDTPVLTLVAAPEVPAIPDSRSLAEWLIAAAILSALIAVGIVLALQMHGILPQWKPGAPSRLTEYGRQLRADLLRPWRLLF